MILFFKNPKTHIVLDNSALAEWPEEERRLNAFDEAVCFAIEEIFNAGIIIFSVNDIYEEMGYPADRLNEETAQKIYRSMKKLNRIEIVAELSPDDLKESEKEKSITGWQGFILNYSIIDGEIEVNTNPLLSKIKEITKGDYKYAGIGK